MTRQQTIGGPAMCAGIGLHSGERARLTFKPAPTGTGIRFVRTDVSDQNAVIQADARNVVTVQLGTTIANEAGVSVATVEHLMAACAGVGVDNLIIEIDGPETPIMDGSSALYCRLLLQAGLKAQAAPRRKLKILEEIEVRDGDKFARLSPAEHDGADMEFRVRIEFDNAAIGEQTCIFRLEPGAFVNDLAFARTFGFAADVEKLKSMGLARGGSLDNSVVLDGDEILNPEGLRATDEFVRHKLLDAVGDLYLAGGAIEGVYDAYKPGHALNNTLVRTLLETPSAWRWTSDAAQDAPISVAKRRATQADAVAQLGA